LIISAFRSRSISSEILQLLNTRINEIVFNREYLLVSGCSVLVYLLKLSAQEEILTGQIDPMPTRRARIGIQANGLAFIL
jgi:hypothetical protein